MKRLKILFFVVLALVGFVGSVTNGIRLFSQFYLWSLARLVGYGSLLAYFLLKLRRARYNSRF